MSVWLMLADGELVEVPPPNFCDECGSAVWPLKGTDVLTCARGHHQPNDWLEP